jgi:hypothetical protein
MDTARPRDETLLETVAPAGSTTTRPEGLASRISLMLGGSVVVTKKLFAVAVLPTQGPYVIVAVEKRRVTQRYL